ncbi:hypothetical protein [Nocardia sp. NPDC020380]|uniref:hypothetical protein n=1 Tax=Nocardia sp. NPDC020380 TaxID=3364309 RepID=UPI0037BDF5FE
MTADYATPAARSELPATVLDGVNWPGPALLLLGVSTLAWALTDTDGDVAIRTVVGSVVTLLALIAGFVWITVEHTRFRAHEDAKS